MKKMFPILMTAALGMTLCFAACAKEKTPPTPSGADNPPFSIQFTGVAGAFDGQTQTATLLFSGAEARAGEITLKTETSPIFPFVYTISESGTITFDFEPGTEATAEGTLHGYTLTASATVQGKSFDFSGTFYAFTEKVDGEVTEDGYITAGYPLNDAATNIEEGDEIEMNGKRITYEEFQAAKMPAESLELNVTKANEEA